MGKGVRRSSDFSQHPKIFAALLHESFRPPFSKGGAVKGAEPLSPLASGETSYTAFLFASFFFAPTVAKEKAAKEFVQSNKSYTFGLQFERSRHGVSAPIHFS